MLIELLNGVKYHPKQIASRSLSNKLDVETPISVFAISEGEAISNEHSELVKLIQVLEGKLLVQVEQEQPLEIKTGEMFVVCPKQQHQITAPLNTKFLQIELPAKD